MKSNDYHPIWFQRNRPYAKYCKQAILTNGFTGMALEEIQGRIGREWNTALDLKKVDKESVVTDFMKEISLSFYFGAFAANGYNLFSFTPQIGEMLANTSAKDIPISALKSPFPVYFIQFHKPILWGKLEISGAYIIDDEAIPCIQVCLVIKPLFASAHWMAAASGYFYLPLSRSSDCSLGEIISKTIDTEISNKWKHATSSMPLDKNTFVDMRSLRAERETMDLSSARESINSAMEYVANCLCYLSCSHDDFESGYPLDAPQSLLNKVDNASLKQAQKAKSQLKSMGYFPVTYVRVDTFPQDRKSSDGQGGGRKLHWRRGHWRNQKRGKGLSLTSLIWIKPTLVGEGEKADSVRVYRVVD